jgi:hypothetical protein
MLQGATDLIALLSIGKAKSGGVSKCVADLPGISVPLIAAWEFGV